MERHRHQVVASKIGPGPGQPGSDPSRDLAGTARRRAFGDSTPQRPCPDDQKQAPVTFEGFFADEYDGMLRVAFLIIGSNAVAEELVQDAFVKAYSRWGQLDNPAGYLRVCVVNGCRDQLRRRRRWSQRASLFVTDETRPSAEPDHLELWTGMLRLPVPQRAAIVLRFYENLTGAEIADTLGVSLPAVKSLLHRGLGQLREEMNHER